MKLEHTPQQTSGSKDETYALKYWGRMLGDKGDTFVVGVKEAMMSSIESAAQTIGPDGGGQFSVFVAKEGMTEEDKQKISAYREMAREMGYEIGQLRRSKSGTAVGTIRRLRF